MSSTARTIALRTEVPSRLVEELERLVEVGWSRSLDDVVVDALRRYVDAHRQALMEELLREDVAWGLRGSE